MAVLGYLPKLKRGLGLTFAAHFLHDFSLKMNSLFNTLSMDKFSVSYLFSFSRYQTKCVEVKWQKFPWHCRVSAGSGKSWKILELEKYPGKSWNALEYLDYFEEFWKSSGILQNVCPVDFLWQIIFMVRSHQIGCIIKQERASLCYLSIHLGYTKWGSSIIAFTFHKCELLLFKIWSSG